MSVNEEKSSGDQALTDAENHIKEACEILKREAGRLRREQKSIDSMTKKMQSVHFASSIKLDVGGHYFKTSLQTLTKDPNSMLAAMFSGRFETKPSEDGAYFIDRDGTHFRFILNYLRTGELTLPDGATFLNELEKEAKFYQLQGVLDQLRPQLRGQSEERPLLQKVEKSVSKRRVCVENLQPASSANSGKNSPQLMPSSSSTDSSFRGGQWWRSIDYNRGGRVK